MKEHIVMVGGGYVSIWAYRQLVKKAHRQIKNGDITITVVCPEENHVFHGWTGEVVTGNIGFNSRLSPLKMVMPLAKQVTGYVTSLDTANSSVSVTLPDGKMETLSYTQLVLGMGTSDSTSIPGSAKHTLRVKALPDLEHALGKMDDLLKYATNSGPGIPKRLVVVGAGFTGVEIATNLAEYLQQQCKARGIPTSKTPTIILVNSQADILPQINTRFKRMLAYTYKIIRQYGIEILNNTSVTCFDANGLQLSDGRYIAADCCMSTVGQSQVQLPGTEQMTRDERGRLETNAILNIISHHNIWGGGDACSVPHYYSKQSCPANALWAIKHGEHIGRNLARVLGGKMPKAFTYKGLGQAASLGLGKGISELYGFQFTGMLSWIMRWFFFMYFMPIQHTRMKALKDWLRVFGLTRKSKNAAETNYAPKTEKALRLAAS